MNITAKDKWPALDFFLLARPDWRTMNEPPTQIETAHGILHEPDCAPRFIEVGDTDASGVDFTFGCMPTGAPAVRCKQTGKVWVGDWVTLVTLAIRDGIAS